MKEKLVNVSVNNGSNGNNRSSFGYGNGQRRQSGNGKNCWKYNKGNARTALVVNLNIDVVFATSTVTEPIYVEEAKETRIRKMIEKNLTEENN